MCKFSTKPHKDGSGGFPGAQSPGDCGMASAANPGLAQRPCRSILGSRAQYVRRLRLRGGVREISVRFCREFTHDPVGSPCREFTHDPVGSPWAGISTPPPTSMRHPCRPMAGSSSLPGTMEDGVSSFGCALPRSNDSASNPDPARLLLESEENSSSLRFSDHPNPVLTRRTVRGNAWPAGGSS